MNLLERYSGARPFSDLYMIVTVSLLMISFILGHLRLCINGLADESKLPLATCKEKRLGRDIYDVFIFRSRERDMS